MPLKRQKPSGDDESSLDAEPATKRKRALQYDPSEFIQELFETVRNHKTDDGRLLCEAFIRLPKRRSEPEYYEKVKNPIDLLKIHYKIRSEEYDDIEDLSGDLKTLIENAKLYYTPDTEEHQDACALWELYQDTKNLLFAEAFGDMSEESQSAEEDQISVSDELQQHSGDVGGSDEGVGGSGTATPMDEDTTNIYCEQLFAAVVTAKEGDKDLSAPFKVLPLKAKNPEYYEVIDNPIDLRTIAQKIQNQAYNSLDVLISDLMLLIDNAQLYNSVNSEIYRQAGLLRRLILSKKNELDIVRSNRGKKSSERLRARRSQAHTASKLSAALCATAAAATSTQDDGDGDTTDAESVGGESYMDDSASGHGDEDEDRINSPLWMLYNIIRNYRNSQGKLLSEPFQRLPSKRQYPDYYDEIDRPMSLSNVHNRLKHKKYKTIDSIAADLDLIFDNAKEYNVDESVLYKDAHKLQQVLKAKKSEILKQRGTDSDASPSSLVRPTARTPSRTPRVAVAGAGVVDKKELLKKRLQHIFKTIYDYTMDGRRLIDIFVMLPSKRDYPDYYQVISEPIDMTIIETKLKTDRYTMEREFVLDLELMFNNARHYNEETSQVYGDAEELERVLKNKLRSLPPFDTNVSPRPQRTAPGRVVKGGARTPTKPLQNLSQRLQAMYDGIKDYTDNQRRVLSTPFMKLPLKHEYPEYYDVIKKPMDMQRIQQKLLSNSYETLDDMVTDCVLMFDNACKFNEPDSLIYKDALTLQRVCLEKKQEIAVPEESCTVPDVKALVQQLLNNIFVSTYNYTDEDGRAFSDSFLDMPLAPKQENDAASKQQTRRPSFEQIQTNLSKGRYRRLDRFQEDILELFHYARIVSRSDSQLFEDAIELQSQYIRVRDNLCRNGEAFLSPALSYTQQHLDAAVEALKKEKMEKEQVEEGQDSGDGVEKMEVDNDVEVAQEDEVESVEHNATTYTIGDFVYIKNTSEGSGPGRVLQIDSLYKKTSPAAGVTNGDNEGMGADEKDGGGTSKYYLKGTWFLHPSQAYHSSSRKLLQQEVFKANESNVRAVEDIAGKCFVASIKEYFKMHPKDIDDKDVYVCESQYCIKRKSFKKLKNNLTFIIDTDTYELVPRNEPLPVTRFLSTCAHKQSESLDIDVTDSSILDVHREVVQIDAPADAEPGSKYFEQYNMPTGSFKIGDHVYVRSDESQPFIARIDKMWENAEGNSFFHGPWLIPPSEVSHPPTRMFYKRELFRSSNEDTSPMLSIQGRCAAMTMKEYQTSRPTEIAEQDVYYCDSRYIENEKLIRKIVKSHLPRNKYCTAVIDDEIIFFKKPISLTKEASPLLPKVEDLVPTTMMTPTHPSSATFTGMLPQDESTNDSTSFPSNLSDITVPELVDAHTEPVPAGTAVKGDKEKKKKGKSKRTPSCYLLYAADRRKHLIDANPEMSFGEISKCVGQEWRELPKSQKIYYEDKAKKMGEEQAAKVLAAKQEAAKQEAADRAAAGVMYPPPASSPAPAGSQLNGHSHLPMHPSGGIPGGPPLPGTPLNGASMPPMVNGHMTTPTNGMQPSPAEPGYAQQHPPHHYPGYPPPPPMLSSPHYYPVSGSPASGQTGAPFTPSQKGLVSHAAPSSTGITPSTSITTTPTFPVGGPTPTLGGASMQSFPPPLSIPQSGAVTPHHPAPRNHVPSYPPTPTGPTSAQTTPYGSAAMSGPPRDPSPMYTTLPPRSQRLVHSEVYLRYIENLATDKPPERVGNVREWERTLYAQQSNTPAASYRGRKLPTEWFSEMGIQQQDDAINALWALRDLMVRDTLTVANTLQFNQL